MPATKTFSYEALDAAGALVKGKIDSESADSAATSLASQRLVPLSVTGSGEGLNREFKLPGIGGRTKLKDLAVYSRQFASMTGSGLTLLRALGILEEQTSAPKLKAATHPGAAGRRGRREPVAARWRGTRTSSRS